uniref:Uncharacterized protein n=1 Tax=viral metagenome TaxID=1070528 RepID=A0A6M3XJK4_9ZZZZ
MKLDDFFKHVEDEHKPENIDVEDYEDLPSLSDRLGGIKMPKHEVKKITKISFEGAFKSSTRAIVERLLKDIKVLDTYTNEDKPHTLYVVTSVLVTSELVGSNLPSFLYG